MNLSQDSYFERQGFNTKMSANVRMIELFRYYLVAGGNIQTHRSSKDRLLSYILNWVRKETRDKINRLIRQKSKYFVLLKTLTSKSP